MLSTVTQDNGFAEFQELSPTKVMVLVALLLLLPILAFLYSCRFSLFRKRILNLDKQYFILRYQLANIRLNQLVLGTSFRSETLER